MLCAGDLTGRGGKEAGGTEVAAVAGPVLCGGELTGRGRKDVVWEF